MHGNAEYNFCEAMDGKLAHNAGVFFIKILQVMAPTVVHRCPYQVLLSFIFSYNFTTNKDILEYFLINLILSFRVSLKQEMSLSI